MNLLEVDLLSGARRGGWYIARFDNQADFSYPLCVADLLPSEQVAEEEAMKLMALSPKHAWRDELRFSYAVYYEPSLEQFIQGRLKIQEQAWIKEHISLKFLEESISLDEFPLGPSNPLYQKVRDCQSYLDQERRKLYKELEKGTWRPA